MHAVPVRMQYSSNVCLRLTTQYCCSATAVVSLLLSHCVQRGYSGSTAANRCATLYTVPRNTSPAPRASCLSVAASGF
jgi:hypothetical protein